MRRERFPNIRRRGGPNRFALAVEHPARRPDRHRCADEDRPQGRDLDDMLRAKLELKREPNP